MEIICGQEYNISYDYRPYYTQGQPNLDIKLMILDDCRKRRLADSSKILKPCCLRQLISLGARACLDFCAL